MSQLSRLEHAAVRAQTVAPSRSIRKLSDRVADLGLIASMRILDFVLDVLGSRFIRAKARC
jgi:hypothetical protein